jgi:predicted phosphodiesterase
MKVIFYSDLHLEFSAPFEVPDQSTADVMVLAGDIIVFNDFAPLEKIVTAWRKPILYIAGNHEYYTRQPMQDSVARFQE